MRADKLLGLLALGSACFLASIDVGLSAQAHLGALAVVLAILLPILKPKGWLLYSILAFTAFVSLRYLLWRLNATLPPLETAGFVVGAMLLAAEAHGFMMNALGLFANADPVDRTPPPLPDDPKKLPTVDVFIPTYNEPVALLRRTVIAATQLDYPAAKLVVHVLDDGGTAARLGKSEDARLRSQLIRELCEEAGARYRTRPDNSEAKAGNINAALKHTSGDLILILDCDHIPSVEILRNTVGFFLEDPKLGFVQTPHFFRNPDPIERNLDIFYKTPSETELFYGNTMRGLDCWNAAFFCGSAALIAREALLAVGGISTRSVTEDADTALDMHAAGYNSVYYDRPMIAGLQPDTIAAFVQQRTRWCQGMLQIWLLNSPVTKAGLSLSQRLGYLSAVSYWLFPLTRLVFLIAPLTFVFFDLHIVFATAPEFVAFILPHIFISLTVTNTLYGKFRTPFVSDVYEAVQSLFMAPAVIATLRRPREAKWTVTPKHETLDGNIFSQLAFPVVLLFCVMLAAQAVGIWRFVNEPYNAQHLAIVLLWNTVNLIIVFAATAATLERGGDMNRLWMPVGLPAQLRMQERGGPVHMVCSNGDEVLVETEDGSAWRDHVRWDRSRVENGPVMLDMHHGIHGIPTRVEAKLLSSHVASDGKFRFHLRFSLDSVAAERAHAAALYGSSARWLGFWTARRKQRSVLGGLGLVLSVGLRRAPAMLAAAFGFGRRRPSAAEVAATRNRATATARRAPLLVTSPPRRIALPPAAAVLLAASLALALIPASAEAQEPSAAPRAAATIVSPLSTLAHSGTTPVLDATRTRARFEFVVNPLTDVSGAELHLGWVAARALAEATDGLAVTLNGSQIDTLVSDGSEKTEQRVLTLPTGGLRPGVNRLEIMAPLAGAVTCGAAPSDYWVSFAESQSFLVLRGQRRAGVVTLADLDRANWRWDVADRAVTILTRDAANDRTLTMGANLAGALSIRRNQPGMTVRRIAVEPITLPARMNASPERDPLPGLPIGRLQPGLNMLIGSVAELRPFLHPDISARVDRPLIGVHHPISMPDSIVVVITAPSSGQAHVAAATLASAELALPAAQWAELPQRMAPDLVRRTALSGGDRYRFDTAEGLVFDPEERTLSFAMPSGFTASDNRKFTMSLNYAYSPGLPDGALLEVVVNGQIARAIQLDRPEGDFVEGRQVQVELARLRAGPNRVLFRTRIAGDREAACGDGRDLVREDVFEVFVDSTIDLPEVLELELLPDLAALFGDDAALARRLGADTTLFLAGRDEALTSAAWTLAARLAHGAGMPLTQLEVRTDSGTDRRHEVWIGTLAQVGGRGVVTSGLSDLSLGGVGEGRGVGDAVNVFGDRRSVWRDELDAVRRPGAAERIATAALRLLALDTVWSSLNERLQISRLVVAAGDTASAFFNVQSDTEITRLPRNEVFEGALAGVSRRSASNEIGATVYAVAVSPEDLEAAIAQITDPERWTQLEGTAAAWRANSLEVATARPVRTAAFLPAGASGTQIALSYTHWLSERPRIWLGMIAALAVTLGAIGAVAIARKHRQ